MDPSSGEPDDEVGNTIMKVTMGLNDEWYRDLMKNMHWKS